MKGTFDKRNKIPRRRCKTCTLMVQSHLQ